MAFVYIVLGCLCSFARAAVVVRPISEIHALDAAAQAPSAAAASAFAVNHSNPVFFQLATRAIEVNACLDNPKPPLGDGLAACMAKSCFVPPGFEIDKSSFVNPFDASFRSMPIIANITFESGTALFLDNGRVMPCKPCLVSSWAKSQTIADLRTLCTQLKTYENASRLLWQIGYTMSHAWEQPNTRCGLLLSRYPHAARLLRLAAGLRAADFCNVYATMLS